MSEKKRTKATTGRLAIRVPKTFLTIPEVAGDLRISEQAARRLYERGTLFGKRERDPIAGGNPRILIHKSSLRELKADRHYWEKRRRTGDA